MAKSSQNGTKKGTGRRGALQVYDALREDILWLRIKPGSALDEVRLADRFDVSRTPIREALLLLSGENFVQFLPNRTTIVSPLQLNNLGDYLDTFLILSRGVARSAASFTGQHDPSLQTYVDAYAHAIDAHDYEAALRADNRFRRHLAGLTENIFQIQYFDQVLDAGVRTKVLYYFPNATEPELKNSVQDLEQLAKSVTDRSADECDRIMGEIIHAEFRIVTRSLKPKFADDLSLSRHPVTLDDVS